MFQLFGNSQSLQKLWRCNPEPDWLTRHCQGVLRSFKFTLTFQRFLKFFLLLPVIFNKDDDNSNNNDNEVFSFFSLHSLCSRWVYFYFVFSHIAPPVPAAWPGSYNGSQLRPDWDRENKFLFVSGMLHSVIHIKLHTLRAAECVRTCTHTRWHWHTICTFLWFFLRLLLCTLLLFSAAAVYLIFISRPHM